MFFDLFGKNKDEFITAYAGKLAETVLEDALDEDVLEELIHYAKEKDLSNKQLASAQAMACDKVFEELYQEGYMTDEDYELYQSLIEACYMMKEKEKLSLSDHREALQCHLQDPGGGAAPEDQSGLCQREVS